MTQGGAASVARRIRQLGCAGAAALALLVATAAPAAARAGDPSKVGDLTGNLPWAVYLLVPLALGLALLTAVVLGPRGDPSATIRRSGGVTRALTDHRRPEHPT